MILENGLESCIQTTEFSYRKISTNKDQRNKKVLYHISAVVLVSSESTNFYFTN